MGRWNYILGIFFLTVVLAGFTLFTAPDENLHIIACNVGQGDGILIINGSNQILIDGGPDNSVIDCLSRHIPFWDRELEMVVNSHPQKDHYGGLTEVFKRYTVKTFLVSGLDSSNRSWQVLEDTVGGKGVSTTNAHCGQKLRLGLMYLDIINPCSLDNIGDPNEASVIFYLQFEAFDALFTGDIYTKDLDLSLAHKVDYLKVPHHGSVNGLGQDWLAILKPKFSIISVGQNSYGHPSQETIDMLTASGTKVLRTDKMGDVEVITDGKRAWVR